jgi:hypothetical protein
MEVNMYTLLAVVMFLLAGVGVFLTVQVNTLIKKAKNMEIKLSPGYSVEGIAAARNSICVLLAVLFVAAALLVIEHC